MSSRSVVAMRVLLCGLVLAASRPTLATEAGGMDTDALLRKVADAYGLAPLAEPEKGSGPLFELGRNLFFDPIISGNRDITCGACHFPRAATADGLPIAVGIGARGVGQARLDDPAGRAQSRNALAFWGVGNPLVKRLFWDGRVERVGHDRIYTPIGTFALSEVGSLVGAAALLPVLEPEEMTGFEGDHAPPWVAHPHRSRINEVARYSKLSSDRPRAAAVHAALTERLLGSGTQLEPWQRTYRTLHSAAYPGRGAEEATFVDFARALAEFISKAFAVKPAAWDRYLTGDRRVISDEAKRGAVIFYGKGKCAACHQGVLFSDFKFHALAVPQIGPGRQGGGIDAGRGSITYEAADNFAFRTPMLRNVALTAPYGHSGYFDSLGAIIDHHANPIPALYRAQQIDPRGAARQAQLVAYLSPRLRELPVLTAEERGSLIEFLESLTSADIKALMALVPQRVPSGLNHVVDSIRAPHKQKNALIATQQRLRPN